MAPENGHSPGSNPLLQKVRRIAGMFDIPAPFRVGDFAGKGNIHTHTFLVASNKRGFASEYLLQMLNTGVFPHPERVMEAWIACTEAQQKSLDSGVVKAETPWELIRLVPTREGLKYLKIEDAGRLEYWRAMERIPRAISHKSLKELSSPTERIRIAEETGKGLGIFHSLTAGMAPENIQEPLPGYRDTQLYYAQLDSVLQGARTLPDASPYLPPDPLVRAMTEEHFLVHLGHGQYRQRMGQDEVRRLVAIAMDHRQYGLGLQKALLDGKLLRSVVHGDTKLDNFLFDPETGKVKALVDLDTVMAHTWLSDWGDMARSLVNVSGENPEDGGAKVDTDIFKAAARGYFGSASRLPDGETDLMVDAARIVALELGVRFLTDYLRGDTYFSLAPDASEDLNRRRATVQFSLFREIGERDPECRRYIRELQALRGGSRT